MREPRRRLLGIGLVAVLCTALSGCTTIRLDCATALQAIPNAERLKVPDVAIAVVTKDGHVFPKRLIVRGEVHAVIWVGEGKTLLIDFKGASIHPVCGGQLCVLENPLPPPPQGQSSVVYPYGGSITPSDGPPVKFDPGLEVVR